MELLASVTTWGMFLLGVVLLIVILLRRSYRYYGPRRGRKKPPKKLTGDDPSHDQPLADAPVHILRWQVEMHDTARDLKAELDSKMRALQVLVRMADEQGERALEGLARARGSDPLRRRSSISQKSGPFPDRCR